MDSKENVGKKAKILKTKMDCPEQWEIDVWENQGWHFCLRHISGHISIYPDFTCNGKIPATYSTSFSLEKDRIGTPVQFSVRDSFSDPNKAVKNQIKYVKKYMDEINEVLQKIGTCK